MSVSHRTGPLDPYEYEPAAQLLQVGADVAPVAVDDVEYPAGQNTHTVAPAMAEYEPALQLAQAVALDESENEPAGQRTGITAVVTLPL